MKFAAFTSFLLDFFFPAQNTNTITELAHFPRADVSDLPAGIHSLYAYNNPLVKETVWQIKYHRNEDVAEHVCQRLAEKIVANTDPQQPYLVLPVPFTKHRLKERGFDHTGLLADTTLRYLPQYFSRAPADILQKVRHTKKQSSLEDRADRFKNLVGAFVVPPPNRHFVQNKNIILLDDVVTTGATVGEISNVLQEAGARSVLMFTLAH